MIDGHSLCPQLIDIGPGLLLVLQNMCLYLLRVHQDRQEPAVTRSVQGQKIQGVGGSTEDTLSGVVRREFIIGDLVGFLGAADKAGVKKVALAGGVACNSRLRQELEKRKDGFDIFYPEPVLCTDNAAMIACSGYYEMQSGKKADLSLNAIPFLAVDLK